MASNDAKGRGGPHILVFDSGLGGLTVLSRIREVRPDARFTYLADDALFPYGEVPAQTLTAHIVALIGEAIANHRPDLVVIACNTASTLVLPPLRAAFDLPFVGTVPAIKTGAEVSRSKLFSVIATPGTVGRDYTHALIEEHAKGCDVTLVGSSRLARLAEDFLRFGRIHEAVIAQEISPAFVEQHGRRTDAVVLACTHYPLLLDHVKALAPWPVEWIDPAPAIARRAAILLQSYPQSSGVCGEGRAIFTSARPVEAHLAQALCRHGLQLSPTPV